MGIQLGNYGEMQAALISISIRLKISNGQGKIWNLFFWLHVINCRAIRIVGNMQMP